MAVTNETYGGLHCFGLFLTSNLQQLLSSHTEDLVFFSHLGDPRYAFLTLFPFTYFLDNHFGLKVIWLASLNEWVNAILKWIARDDRPYWWYSTDCSYSGKQLQQFSITCESGPGFPSGHVMSMSSLSLLLFLYVYGAMKSNRSKALVLGLGVPLYVVLVSLVSLSRVFIATHFPHQVLVGAVVGIVMTFSVHTVASRNSPSHLLHKNSALVGAFLLALALLLFQLLSWLQLNPLSSVDLALNYCAKREWVHVDTTLFFAVVRDVGSLCGISLSAVLFQRCMGGSELRLRSLGGKRWPEVLRCLSFGTLFCFVISLGERVRLPQGDLALFYCMATVKYMLIVCFVIVGESMVNSYVESRGNGKNK